MPFESSEEFLDFLSEDWQIPPPNQPPPKKNVRKFSFKGKAKFYCSQCDNTWSSSMCIVEFSVWKSQKGNDMVYARDFGQLCKFCAHLKVFEAPEWYEDERERLTQTLMDALEGANNNRPQRRGFPRKEHDREKCEACARNIEHPGAKSKKKRNRNRNRRGGATARGVSGEQ